MTFDEVLTQVLDLLQRDKRVSYRALKVRFQLDDDLLEAVKDELIYAKKLAIDEKIASWCGLVLSKGLPRPPLYPTRQYHYHLLPKINPLSNPHLC